MPRTVYPLIFCLTLLAWPRTDYISAQEKSDMEIWEEECVAEYRRDLEIFGKRGHNERRILQISICISRLTRPCIRYLRDVCPVAARKNISHIKEAQERMRMKDSMKRTKGTKDY